MKNDELKESKGNAGNDNRETCRDECHKGDSSLDIGEARQWVLEINKKNPGHPFRMFSIRSDGQIDRWEAVRAEPDPTSKFALVPQRRCHILFDDGVPYYFRKLKTKGEA